MRRSGESCRKRRVAAPCTEPYYVEPYKRFFAVREKTGSLVVVAVYRKGADEVVRRLTNAREQHTEVARCCSRSD